jgi:hypothetical protein
MNIAIIGFGKVGKAIYNLIRPRLTHDERIDKLDPALTLTSTLKKEEYYDVIHVTIPFLSKDQYRQAMYSYASLGDDATMWIIHSTLDPNVLTDINPQGHRFYSPIRNRERQMTEEMEVMPWLIAPLILHNFNFLRNPMKDYLQEIGVEYVWYTDAYALAYGKLMETTWFGMEIAFCQMMQIVCQDNDWNFDEAYTHYVQESRIGKDYRMEPVQYIPRSVFVPNVIEGTCVMQNIKLVKNGGLADSVLLKFIEDTNAYTKDQRDRHG